MPEIHQLTSLVNISGDSDIAAAHRQHVSLVNISGDSDIAAAHRQHVTIRFRYRSVSEAPEWSYRSQQRYTAL